MEPHEHTAVAATNIRAILVSRGMTQRELGEAADMMAPEVSRLLRAGRPTGRRWATSLATLARIAEALEVPLAQLLTPPAPEAEHVNP